LLLRREGVEFSDGAERSDGEVLEEEVRVVGGLGQAVRWVEEWNRGVTEGRS
jgi:hypothetical protein